MEINRSNNVNFGSHFKLQEGLTEQTAKIISEKLNPTKPESPFRIFVIDGKITHITSILDQNDGFVKNILKNNDVKIATEEKSIDYYIRNYKLKALTDKTITNAGQLAADFINSFVK